MSQGLAAAFADRSRAEQAIKTLVEAGIPRSRIDLRSGALGDQVGPPVVAVTGAHRVALICAILAGVIGAVIAVLMVLGFVPQGGFEFLGTSVLGAGLRGLGAGVGAGALFGYILGLGMWDDDGEPETAVTVGDVIVSLSGTADTEIGSEVLRNAGGRLL